MKIGLRGGHSPNCKGAIGVLDEQAEVRKIYSAMVPMLKAAGYTVIDCNSNSSTVNGELSEGTNKANSNKCDMYITIHMNASGGAGHGTECWMYDAGNATMNAIADRINANFAAKGFTNRGRKYSTGLHDLNASSMPAMIVETLFCDNQHDANLYRKIGVNGIAKLIVSGITGKAVQNNQHTQSQSPTQVPGKAVNNSGLYYRSHVQTYGWLDPVHDGQVSGTTGKGKRLEALKMDTRKLGDVELEVTVHIQGIGDKTYKVNKDTHDIVIGTTNQSKRIEAISIKIAKGLKGKHIKYRIHVAKIGWSSWKQDGALLGSEGLSNAIQAIQIKIE